MTSRDIYEAESIFDDVGTSRGATRGATRSTVDIDDEFGDIQAEEDEEIQFDQAGPSDFGRFSTGVIQRHDRAWGDFMKNINIAKNNNAFTEEELEAVTVYVGNNYDETRLAYYHSATLIASLVWRMKHGKQIDRAKFASYIKRIPEINPIDVIRYLRMTDLYT